MTNETAAAAARLVNELADDDPERQILLADGFEDALLGYVERFGMGPVALYDKDKCIEILEAQGSSYDDAVEYFDYNVIGAWVGEGTPAFATLARKETTPSSGV